MKKKRYAIVIMTRGIGGAAARFAYLFSYIRKNKPSIAIDLIINKNKYDELVERGVLDPRDKNNVIILKDKGKNGSLVYKLFFVKYVLYLIFFGFRYQSIHFVSAAKIGMVFICKLRELLCLKKPRLGTTFASLNLEMANYGLPPSVIEQLSMSCADYIDQLNPKGELPYKLQKKSVWSPCSFLTFDINPYGQLFLEKEDAVCFVGTFQALKNPLLLVRAIPLVLQELDYVKFYFIGSGPLKAMMAEEIQKLPVAWKKNILIEFQSNPVDVLKKTRIFCSLQTYTNYPSQALLEAMYAKNYVIATNTGDTDFLLKEGNYFYLLPKLCEKELAESILAFFKQSRAKQRSIMEEAYMRLTAFASIEVFVKYFLFECLRYSEE